MIHKFVKFVFFYRFIFVSSVFFLTFVASKPHNLITSKMIQNWQKECIQLYAKNSEPGLWDIKRCTDKEVLSKIEETIQRNGGDYGLCFDNSCDSFGVPSDEVKDAIY